MFAKTRNIDQIHKDRLKQLLNEPISLTHRAINKKQINCKTLQDSTGDENFIFAQPNTTKNDFQERKFSWNDVILHSDRKIMGTTLRSPRNIQQNQLIYIPKMQLESPENTKQSFYFGLPQISKKAEQSQNSQIGVEIKKVDSTILTVNTNEQLMDAQLERNAVLQNNFKLLSVKVLNMLETLRNDDHEKLDQTLEELLIFIQQTSRTELELSKMVNLNLKQSNKLSHVNLLNQKLNEKLQYFQDRFNLNSCKSDELQEKCLKSLKEINQYKKMISNQKKKIDQLEQRLDFLLTSEFLNDQQMPKNQNLRKVLTELVKENENLKRDNTRKDIEVKRLQDQKQSLNLKLSLLNQKIDSLKSRISVKDLEDMYYEQNQTKPNGNHSSYKDNNNILQNDEIPEKLDFRINQLRHEYKTLMIDLCEHGSNIFIEQYTNMKDEKRKVDWLKLILSQFLSYKEFSERSNKICQMVHHLETIDSIDDLLREANKYIKTIFKCNQGHAWLYDQFTGIFYTIKEDKSELRALNSKGLFSEVVRHQIASNKTENEEFIVYEQIMQKMSLQSQASMSKQKVNEKQENWVYSDSSLCIPLISKGKKNQTIGILEITDSKCKIFSIDDEYCAVLISQFLNNQVKRIKTNRKIAMQHRYKDFLQESFMEFIQCKDKISFTNAVAIWLQRIFTITQFRLYFVKDNKFYNYKNEEFSSKHGWAGHVLQLNQAIIVQNIKSSENYDPLVDMYSILPIQIKPVTHNNQMVAILEIPLKRCNRTPSVQDDFTFSNSPLMGLDNSFENAMKSFCKHLSIALTQNKIE